MDARPIGIVTSSHTDPGETVSPIKIIEGNQHEFSAPYSFKKGFDPPPPNYRPINHLLLEEQWWSNRLLDFGAYGNPAT